MFHAASPSSPTDTDLRAGSGAWWIQEHPERPPSLRERQARPRQVQDPATDPTGQHQAEDWRVRGLIRSPGPFLNGHRHTYRHITSTIAHNVAQTWRWQTKSGSARAQQKNHIPERWAPVVTSVWQNTGLCNSLVPKPPVLVVFIISLCVFDCELCDHFCLLFLSRHHDDEGGD